MKRHHYIIMAILLMVVASGTLAMWMINASAQCDPDDLLCGSSP